MSDIRVNDLAVLSPSALDDTYNTIVFTSDGDTNQVVFEDAVAQAVQNLDYGVRTYTQIIDTSDVLTSNATPVAIAIPRVSGKTVYPISVNFAMNGSTTPYATNTVAALRYVGADVEIFSSDFLGKTINLGADAAQLTTSVGAGQTQIISDTDLEFFTKTGDPTAGDGNLIVAIAYLIY